MSSPILLSLVRTIRYEASGIISVELTPSEGSLPFPSFTAGSHIDLHLPNGLVRSYSLVNPMTDSQRYVIAILHDRNSRGGSKYVHEQLKVGMTLPISGPRNNFTLEESASHTVLIAGGIGVTPMLCMFERLIAQRKTVDFIYCARSRREAAFMHELSKASDTPGVSITYHFDDERNGPPDLRSLLEGRPSDTHLYCCGPGRMLDSFQATCEALGYPHCHIERFAAAPVPENSDLPTDGYTVELRRTGKALFVSPGRSLLDVLLEAGVSHDFSCREGICGACETKVLAGEVDHRDSILGKDERAQNKSMMVCVSGCKKGPLVLDI